MPCPVCACDATRPLAMREVNGFAGASYICDSCLSVWFVLSDAVISRVALAGAARGWQSVRAVLTEAVDAIADHPAVREHLASPGVCPQGLAQGLLMEVEVPLHGESSRASDGLHLLEAEAAPLVLEAGDVAEEYPICRIVLRGVPRPAAGGMEVPAHDEGIESLAILGADFREPLFHFCCQEFHVRTPLRRHSPGTFIRLSHGSRAVRADGRSNVQRSEIFRVARISGTFLPATQQTIEIIR